MKKNTVIVMLVIALILSVSVSFGIYAATEKSSMTLISLDYVENSLKPWVREQVSAGDGAYEIVYLTKGQKLLPDDTAELVVRSGSAVSVSPFTTQGLSDLTNGAELFDGMTVEQNHQVLVPRGDGRGILITSSQSYVMIRGPYTVE